MDGPCHQFCGQVFREIACFVDTEWIDGHSHSFCGQAGRDGEVFSRRGRGKLLFFVRLFPGGAENNLFIFDYGCWWQGVRVRAWDGVISRPTAGALEGAPAVVRE